MAPIAGYLRMSEKSRRMNSKGKEQFRFVPISTSDVKSRFPRFNPATTNILVTSTAASEKKKNRHRADSHMPDLYVLADILEAECKDDTWQAQIVDIIGESTDLGSCATVMMYNRGLTEGNQTLQARKAVNDQPAEPRVKGKATVFKKTESSVPDVATKSSRMECEQGRVDLRGEVGTKDAKYTIFSVDPPGCLDIDDAVHIRLYEPEELVSLQPQVLKALGWQGLVSEEKDDKLASVTLYEVGVHIADVTNYIKRLPAVHSSPPEDGSKFSGKTKRTLMEEALHRSFTVYLPDKQIPILPTFLSHEECSLKPGEDKLALSCLVTIACSNSGVPLDIGGKHCYKVISNHFQRSLICTAGAYSYDQVDQFLDNQQAITKSSSTAAVTASTSPMSDGDSAVHTYNTRSLEHIVREQNPEAPRIRTTSTSATSATATTPASTTASRGNLSNKAPSSAVKYSLKLFRKLYPTLNSHEIVEQLMLLANTCAAEYLEAQCLIAAAGTMEAVGSSRSNTNAFLVRRQLPAKFNVTADAPSMEDLSLGDAKSAGTKSDSYQKKSPFSGVPVDFTANPAEYLYCPVTFDCVTEEGVVKTLTAVEKAHVSLGARLYTHFTSPIRRYADQIVHALIDQFLNRANIPGSGSDAVPQSESNVCTAVDPWLQTFTPDTVAHINMRQKQHKKFSRDMTIVEFVFDQCALAGRNEVTVTAEAVVLPFRFSEKYRALKTDLYVFAPCEFVYPVRLHTAAQAQLFDITYTDDGVPAVLLQSRQTKEIKRLRVGDRITVEVHCSRSAPTIRKKCVVSSPSITFA